MRETFYKKNPICTFFQELCSDKIELHLSYSKLLSNKKIVRIDNLNSIEIGIWSSVGSNQDFWIIVVYEKVFKVHFEKNIYKLFYPTNSTTFFITHFFCARMNA